MNLHPAPIGHPTVIGPASLDLLERDTGLDARRIESRLGTPLLIADAEHRLSERERQVALTGGD